MNDRQRREVTTTTKCGRGATMTKENESANEESAEKEPETHKTFTQDEVNELMGKVRRETRDKFPDYEELKKKAKAYDDAQEAAKTELEKAQEAASKAQEEVKALKAEKERADLAAKVSAATGVPVNLITGSDEESMTASAKAIAAYARSASTVAPQDKGGAAHGAPLSKESVLKMTNPMERVMAYARSYEGR